MSVRSRSNWNLKVLVFKERGKPEKNLSEQGREPTTNSTHIWRRRQDSISIFLVSPSRLQKFKQVLVFNKCTLAQRIRDAIVSEKLGSQTIETDTTFSQIESPANGQDNPRVDDIYSFIEIKVKEVCRLEIEKLKQKVGTSYSNETIASLWEENNLLNIRLQELESRNESLREEGSFENEALENKDRSRKHPNLKNEAPKTRKRSTQISKTKHPKIENEAPKTRNLSVL